MKPPSIYGHRLDPELERLLRDRPPPAALDWALEAAGAARVLDVQPLPGGTSSAVHALTLELRSGGRERVVLRRFVLDWLAEEPDAPANEARMLEVLEPTSVRAPRLVAADPTGAATGTPALLMTSVPGQVEWSPAALEPWLQRLAEALVDIHAVPLVAGMREWFPYAPAADLMPPTWSAQPRAWERAVELYAGPPPVTRRVFLHRDYHPGNVLWSGGRISGVVDWVSGCAGPPEEDVSHCRANLARHTGDHRAGDRFLAIWQSLSGTPDYHPYWDLTTIVSMDGASSAARMDDFCARAAARL